MFEVALLEVPFADIGMPSLALTRLKYVVEQAHSGSVHVRVLYLNHEFARFLGIDFYQEIALNMRHLYSGVGDWLFRQVAFPGLPDNTNSYLNRYYATQDRSTRELRDRILEKRPKIEEYLDYVIEKYDLVNSNLIGLTSMFSQNVACFAFSRKLKLLNPKITVVMGGSNCEYPMGREIIENVETIDAVFSGPALISFPTVIRLQLNGGSNSLDEIPGVFKRSNGGIRNHHRELTQIGMGVAKPPKSVLGEELDIDTPIPLDYGDYIESYKQLTGSRLVPSIPFETSRGCWWGEKAHCTFCGLNTATMGARVMKPALALEQIRSLFAYSSRCRILSCIDNILPKNYLKDVLPHLDTPTELSIFYETKADLSEEDVRTLAKARVNRIQPGIEALASSTLKLMKKGITSFQNITLLKNCRKHGIEPTWNLLVGFPGEQEAVFQKYCRDIPLLVHLQPPTGVYPVRFDRYSPYFDQADAYGLDLRPYDFYGMIYPFSESTIRNIAYYFLDYNFEASYFTQLVKWLTPLREAVEAWKTKWSGIGGRNRPRLEMRIHDDRTDIFDSRSGNSIEYELTANGATLLNRLNVQTSLDRLLAEFESLPGFDIEKELAILMNRGLVFEEERKLISLALTVPTSDRNVMR